MEGRHYFRSSCEGPPERWPVETEGERGIEDPCQIFGDRPLIPALGQFVEFG